MGPVDGHEERQDYDEGGLAHSIKQRIRLKSSSVAPGLNDTRLYHSQNRNIDTRDSWENGGKEDEGLNQDPIESEEPESAEQAQDTTETAAMANDPRQRRKAMKHMKRDDAGRQVTDPVTHLGVTIHDSTEKELTRVPENMPPPGSSPRTSTGLSSPKSGKQLKSEEDESNADHRGMEKLFPPPNFDTARDKLVALHQFAISVGIGAIWVFSTFLLTGSRGFTLLLDENHPQRRWSSVVVSSFLPFGASLLLGGCLIWGLRDWVKRKIHEIWEDEVWDAARTAEKGTVASPIPESTQWLNSLLSSIWTLINPDLFTSLADTLEDVMVSCFAQ